ncbi:FAD-binding oxidoreductase [Thermostichus vulcanus]|uniref:FAD-binding oxidoreductase n=1 Tax=Thermostichus vulcanus str. 'Rupite' TaxID=2813851 RepID=A0ABT0C8Q4_THEVL|nr:FAD-binding oxidoreductase [Thermostichus vulcanus]MCJ2542084.1 FAD-binding oxidoreductase [Thermostichus vulcanus str. 'Rupite']
MTPGLRPADFKISERSTALTALQEELEGIPCTTEPQQLSKLSIDWHTFSPVLSEKLAGKRADIVYFPTSEAEVIRIIQACVRHRIPLTPRGAGTGNYGQAVPLEGGVVLDITRMQSILWTKGGIMRVQPGVKLMAMEKEARKTGWEVRMAPSTFRTATVGGFVSGGFGGIGSITYGVLRERGNILGLQVVTMEAEPQILELRGEAVHQVSHAWGVNGIITEMEMPLGMAYPWAECIVVFDDFMQSARFCQRLGESDGIVKRMISLHAWPIPSYFVALKPYLPEGSHAALLLIAENSLEPLADLVKEWGGQITYTKPAAVCVGGTTSSTGKGITLMEYGYNHTTLHARTADPSLTYIDCLFPADPDLKAMEYLYRTLAEEMMIHIEYLRLNGKVTALGGQLVRYTSEARLREIMQIHRDQGVHVHDCHDFTLDSLQKKDASNRNQQLELKKRTDPLGLLNPGKLKAWMEWQAQQTGSPSM